MSTAVTIGEAMVELRPGDRSFAAGVAGDAYNTAARLASAGWQVTHAQDLGDDLLLDRLRRDFAARSVQSAGRELATRTNGMYLVAVDSEGERRFEYHRAGSAAGDTASAPPSALLDAVSGADVVYLTGVTVAIMADLDGLVRLLDRARGRIAVGLNLRSGLFRREGSALVPRAVSAIAADLREVLLRASMAFGSAEEWDTIAGDGDGSGWLEHWQASEPSRIGVMTLGREGARAWFGDGATASAAALDVRAVDTSGAGDALAAGVVDALGRGLDPEASLERGLRAGAGAVVHDGALPPL